MSSIANGEMKRCPECNGKGSSRVTAGHCGFCLGTGWMTRSRFDEYSQHAREMIAYREKRERQ